MSLLENVMIHSMVPATTGTANITSSKILDMDGYDGVMYIQTIAGNTNSTGGYAHLQYLEGTSSGNTAGTTSSTNFYVDNGTTTYGALDDQVLVLDVYKPLKRWTTVLVGKDSTNAGDYGCIAIQYKSRTGPISQLGSTETYGVYASATRVSPTS